MKELLAFSNIVCFLFACADSSVIKDPVAEFSFQFFGDCSSPTVEIRFTNNSKNADSYFWDFGDGTFSEEENPTKIYAKAGKFTVRLIAKNTKAESATSDQITVVRNSDGTGPVVSVTFQQSSENFLLVNFTITLQGVNSLRWMDTDIILSNPDTVIYRSRNFVGPGRYSIDTFVTGNDGGTCNSFVLDLKP
jgi:PKD repeat protein